jgi:CRP-like cAMP-binding protein
MTPAPINALLTTLPTSDYLNLAPYLERISLASGQVLSEPNERMRSAYFPEQAVISIVSAMEDGSTTEIGMVGQEGMLGLPIVLGGQSTLSRTIVQIAGSALKLDADILKQEFERAGMLQKLLLLYTQALLTQTAQTAACNRRHSTAERFARWLLIAQDGSLTDELSITQEFIAQMLGIRRAGITVAAHTFQQMGAIRYTRGKITIVNRPRLEAAACECYAVVQREYRRLLVLG